MYSRSTLFLAAAIYAGSAAAAGASDVYEEDINGSIKDNAIETILVPEAVEIPETMSWYLRADYGYRASTSADIATTLPGVISPEGSESLSVGFGRYLSPNLRIDFTGDYGNEDTIYNRAGTFVETIFRQGTVTRIIAGTPTEVDDLIRFNLNLEGSEVVTFRNHTIMANLYYDVGGFGRFKPYVGGGLGFSIYEINTARRVNFVDCDSFASDGAALVNCDIEQADADAASQDRDSTTVSVGFAASATVGASYELTQDVSLDVNYRLTYSGANVVGVVNGFEDTIDVQDKLDHDIRVGLRYDIW